MKWGSAVTPGPADDMESHACRVARLAWSAGLNTGAEWERKSSEALRRHHEATMRLLADSAALVQPRVVIIGAEDAERLGILSPASSPAQPPTPSSTSTGGSADPGGR